MPSGVTTSVFAMPIGTGNITVPALDVRTYYNIRNFVGASTDDFNLNAARGIVAREAGLYAAEALFDIELTSAGPGEWGVELVLARHDGTTETILDDWVITEHTDALTGADEDFLLTLVAPPLHMDAGDYFYCRALFTSEAGNSLSFNLIGAPQPDPSVVRIRRYTPGVSGLSEPARATDVLSLADAKADLRIEADETGHDDLITQQIAAAVDWVGAAIDAPLLTAEETLLVDFGSGSDIPIRVRVTNERALGSMRYWTLGQTYGEAPTGLLDLSQARTTRIPGSPYLYVYPPGGVAWPAAVSDYRQRGAWRNRGGAVGLMEITRGLVVNRTINPALRQAVMLLVRKLYDGIEPMSSPTLDRLLAPYRDNSI